MVRKNASYGKLVGKWGASMTERDCGMWVEVGDINFEWGCSKNACFARNALGNYVYVQGFS